MKSFLIFLALFSGIAFAQQARQYRNTDQNQDSVMCVDAGGVEKCLTVEGTTGDVIIPEGLKQGGEALNAYAEVGVSGAQAIVTGGVTVASLTSTPIGTHYVVYNYRMNLLDTGNILFWRCNLENFTGTGGGAKFGGSGFPKNATATTNDGGSMSWVIQVTAASTVDLVCYAGADGDYITENDGNGLATLTRIRLGT
jgi:hypothetical protein